MFGMWTRAQFREEIRHKFKIVTPFDLGTGNAGDTPQNQPNPTNAQINSALDEAVARINKKAGVHTSNLVLSVPAVTASGAQALSLLSLFDNLNAARGSINNVQRVWWSDNLGVSYRSLLPTDIWETDRNQAAGQYYAPATPQSYYVQGYVLWLLPPSASGGLLSIIAGTGLSAFVGDTATLDQVSADDQWDFLQVAVAILRANDAGSAENAAWLAANCPSGIDEMDALYSMMRAVSGRSGEYQPTLSLGSYRYSPGSRRIRR